MVPWAAFMIGCLVGVLFVGITMWIGGRLDPREEPTYTEKLERKVERQKEIIGKLMHDLSVCKRVIEGG